MKSESNSSMPSPPFLVRCLFASLLRFPWTTRQRLHECPLEAKHGTVPSFSLVVDGKKCRRKCISTSTEVAPLSWLWDKLHSSASRFSGLLYKAGEVSGPMDLLSQLFVCVPYAPTSRAVCREKFKEMSYIQTHHPPWQKKQSRDATIQEQSKASVT